MSEMTIVQGTELMEYFRERVKLALTHQQLAASEMTEYYLVNLLQEFRTTEKLFAKTGDGYIEKPLAVLLLEAMEGNNTTRMRCLKKLGDTALYIAGFFSDNLNRKLVDQDYYISMGGSAYRSLEAILANEKTFCELYGELAAKFPELVNILAEVAPWHNVNNDSNLLRIYERWLLTGDEKLEALLKRHGISIDATSPQGRLQ